MVVSRACVTRGVLLAGASLGGVSAREGSALRGIDWWCRCMPECARPQPRRDKMRTRGLALHRMVHSLRLCSAGSCVCGRCRDRSMPAEMLRVRGRLACRRLTSVSHRSQVFASTSEGHTSLGGAERKQSWTHLHLSARRPPGLEIPPVSHVVIYEIGAPASHASCSILPTFERRSSSSSRGLERRRRFCLTGAVSSVVAVALP